MGNSYLHRLLSAVLATEEIEITCQECYDVLDSYAEQLLEGIDPEAQTPGVTQHLKQCFCCEHQFDALMVMLQEAAEASSVDN